MDASIILWVLLGILVNALVLYVVIRVGVKHGILSVRRQDAEDADRAAMRAAGIRSSDLD